MFITGVNKTGNKFIAGDNEPVNYYRRWQLHRWTIIAGDNYTGNKFIAGDKNKDDIEMGSCQG
jgi:hypothetical protein